MTDKLAKIIMQRCDQLAQFSEIEGQLSRGFLTKPMIATHDLVKKWMQEANMITRLDAVGNLIACKTSHNKNAKTLLIGSHLDTVRNAGKYDGIIGVLIAIAAVEILKDKELPFHIDVVAFSEEEGVRYKTPMFGSKAVIGKFDNGYLDLVDNDGISMKQALINYGLDPHKIPQAAYKPKGVLGFLEVHIEQGPRLAAMDKPVAIVSAINGATWATASFVGKAGHAGTSPMDLRQDALLATAEIIIELEKIALSTDGLVGTVGQLEVRPGSSNVIPALTEFSLDIRHSEDKVRQQAVDKLLARADDLAKKRKLEFNYCENTIHKATAMDSNFINILKEIDPLLPIMPSGAGHDAMILAEFTPTAMLFVRSPNGISHNPEEIVWEEDIEAALSVVVRFIEKLANLK